MGATPTTGNTLIAVIRTSHNAYRSVSSITETGVTWSLVVDNSHTSDTYSKTEIWIGSVGATPSTAVLIQLSGTCNKGGADICEYSGALTVDKTAVNSGTTDQTDTGTTATTTDSSEVWVGAVGIEYANQSTPTNGFSLQDEAGGMGESISYLEKIVSSTGTANSGTTRSLAWGDWVSCIATFKVTASDTTPPTYSGLSVSNNVSGISVRFRGTFTDETSLGQYSFSTNNTGSWVYDSPVSFTTRPQTVSVYKTLNATLGLIVGYRWNFTDGAGNANNTGILTLTTRGWTVTTYDSSGETTSDYVIWQNATSAYVNRTSDHTIVYVNTNIPAIFNYAYTNGINVYVRPATYTSSAVVYWNKNDSQITFEQGALLSPANGVNAPIFEIYNSGSYGYGYHNITIRGLQIDGNWLNTGLSSSGLVVMFSSNVTIIGANITKCRMYGIDIYSEGASNPSYNCSIRDSLVTFSAWNGITLYDSIADYDSKQSVLNTEVAYTSDVGISVYSKGCTIANNFLHDQNGTYNTQAHYGIDTEAETGAIGGFDLIYNNTLVGGGNGISCEGSSSNLIKDNYVDCATGVFIDNNGYNVVTQNTIMNYSSGYNFGIAVYWGKNNIISNNTVEGSSVSAGQTIFVHNSTNIVIMNNSVVSPQDAIYVETHADFGIVKTNTVQGTTGIFVGDSSCINNTLVNNIYVSCTTNVTDSGTGTRINPSSSNNYTLTIDDSYCSSTINPVEERYSYSNSSSVLITLTPETLYGAVLNVDGVNVTLSSNTYNLTMGTDRAVYAMFDYNGISTIVLTVTSPTNRTYPSSTVSVQLSAVGGTIDKTVWNCTFSNSTVVYATQVYVGATSMTLENGTYVFKARANNTDAQVDEKTVYFSVQILTGVDHYQYTFLIKDRDGNVVNSLVSWKLYNSSTLLQYVESEYTLVAGTYTLKTYYGLSLINQTDFATATYGNTTIHINLEMKRHVSVSNGYLAFNATVTSLVIDGQSPENLTFTVSGITPMLIYADVPKNASYVQKNGANQTGWTYSTSPSPHIVIETSSLSIWSLSFPSEGESEENRTAGGLYRVVFRAVGLNSLPIQNVRITISGYIRLTDALGLAVFNLPYGDHSVVATFGNETKRMNVFVNGEKTYGLEFNYDVVKVGEKFSRAIFVIPFVAFIACLVFLIWPKGRKGRRIL